MRSNRGRKRQSAEPCWSPWRSRPNVQHKQNWPDGARPLPQLYWFELPWGRSWAGPRGSRAAFALCLLARELSCPANGFGLFAGALLRGLLVIIAELHLAEDAFALHFLLQRPEGLIDIVIANDDLHARQSPFLLRRLRME